MSAQHYQPTALFAVDYYRIVTRNEDGTYSEDESAVPDEQLLLELSRAGLLPSEPIARKLREEPEGTPIRLVGLNFTAPEDVSADSEIEGPVVLNVTTQRPIESGGGGGGGRFGGGSAGGGPGGIGTDIGVGAVGSAVYDGVKWVIGKVLPDGGKPPPNPRPPIPPPKQGGTFIIV